MSAAAESGIADHTTMPTNDLAACRALVDPIERLACYDGIPLAAADQPVAKAPVATTDRDINPADDNPAALFGLDPVVRSQTLEQAAGIQLPDFIEAAVVVVRMRADRRLELTLDNGQRWLQVESAALQASLGDRVRIRQAALGSFLLQVNGIGRGYRVRRLPPASD